MATETQTIHQRAVRSTVAMKALMAVTGLIMIGFLLMHMYGNMKMFVGRDTFNEYSQHLRVFLEPIFQPMWFLWLFRGFMVLAIVLHIYSAVTLWLRARASAGSGRYQSAKFLQGAYVPFFMRWGGITIGVFLVCHILQFTAQQITVGYSGDTDPASRMILGFQNVWVWILYFIAMVAVCFHVAHGFWSAFATLGANLSKKSENVLRGCAIACAVLLFVGFMAAPTSILLHWIH